MKKLYKKCTVHPTPPLISNQLSFLPASILTLTVALSPNDREVLCYLLSCSSNNYTNINNDINNNNDHATHFNCSCFTCYMSFWVRWDASPNRQLIHEIIDAYEDGLNRRVKKERRKKIRKRKGNKRSDDNVVIESGELSLVKSELKLVEDEFVESCIDCGDEGEAEEEGEELEVEKGSIRRFVSFVGEKFWGLWK